MTPAEIIFNWWSNYKYTNHTNFSGEPPKMGEYVYFHGQVRKRDTVMFSSREDRSKPFVQITAHYYALLTDGSSFDDSFQREEPFSFPIGQGRTIAGWEEGLALFKEGAKFILFIPPSLGYGEAGVPPRIPGNAVLVFYIELMGVE
jgi:FKBP-type peptidyl-prolyl cis-trans isomerase